MRVEKQFGLIAGAVLIAAFGFSSLGQAAPIAGAASVQATQEPAKLEALLEKVHYTGHPHTHHHHHHHHTHHHYHHHHHRAMKGTMK